MCNLFVVVSNCYMPIFDSDNIIGHVFIKHSGL